jgi:hypothetical protein
MTPARLLDSAAQGRPFKATGDEEDPFRRMFDSHRSDCAWRRHRNGSCLPLREQRADLDRGKGGSEYNARLLAAESAGLQALPDRAVIARRVTARLPRQSTP